MLDQPTIPLVEIEPGGPSRTENSTSEARRILCVFPRYEPSFGSFEYAYDITGSLRAFMPPQGLLVIAAALPQGWEVKFVDENIVKARKRDFRWADAVFVSGMHVQRRQIDDIRRRAHAAGKPAILGGSSVSASPEYYPDFDYLHIGEMGDATRELFSRLAEDCSRPRAQVRFETRERLPLNDFPIPAYELVSFDHYFIGSMQFSSGCPYECEFCDIPALYGRVPRYKSPQRVIAELDKLRACGLSTAVYFVDDNFIANRRAARELIPHLIEWQERNAFPLSFAFEATLNIAKYEDLLAMMRAACFTAIFCGVETPEPEALHSMSKDQNLTLPILEAVRRLNAHGMEVIAGIIVGLDTDSPETRERIIDFVEQSHIPMLTLNLLQALPRTPLWDRLAKEKRLSEDDTLESNVVFKLPYEQTIGIWRACLQHAYAPARLYERYDYQTRHTFPNRRPRPRP
ncbi:B12-binding domain-containing radical SAM protein, partial [Methylocapsa sp. S129]|uniref:B12-binding domain-containing radical SAM protein n=1 Tax=Methylocapsa sp. S129 TaxID=1641869 RepID=UPI00131AFA66